MKRKIVILIAVLFITIAVIYLCTYNKEETKTNEISTDKQLVNITYDEAQDVFDEDIIGTIEIKKIGLLASVKEGSNGDILEKYIGHIEKTAIYDGNVGLAAHNRGYEYSYFARINELQYGDIVTFETKFGKRNYEIKEKKVIFETDWSMLNDTEDNRITMITCIPNKDNQRLCVQAIEREEDVYD